MSRHEQDDRSDEELARLAASEPTTDRGRLAASTLLERYQRRTYQWCYRYAHEHEAALDLAQEVLIKAYRALDSFRAKSSFGTWIFVLARNHCISSLRSPPLLIDEEIELHDLHDGDRLADEVLMEQEDEESILLLIRETLDEREQQAIWLRCMEKVSVDEISRLMNIRGPSGARGLLQTARRKLRTKLEFRRRREGRRNDLKRSTGE